MLAARMNAFTSNPLVDRAAENLVAARRINRKPRHLRGILRAASSRI
jgi:hypothetical protein